MKHIIDKITILRMKSQLLASKNVKGLGRILKDSPFRRLPAVDRYDIINNPYNYLLEKLGIKLRLPKSTVIELNEVNEESNIYMRHILSRIRTHVKNGAYAKAWKVAKLNIKYSKAFRASAFNHVCKGWYYNMSTDDVFKINRKVQKIIKSESANLDYKRVYIPKPNGKVRPLGVPTVEWRIVLHLINGFFVEILRASLLPNQHAYLPNKGTMSAWNEVVNKVMSNKFIFETDLKGFFNEVSVWKILDVLDKTDCNLKEWFLRLCESKPKLPKEEKLDESKFKTPTGLWSLLTPIGSKARETGWMAKTVNGVTYSVPPKENILNDLKYSEYIWRDLESKGLKTRLEFDNYGLIPGGVPQGSPMSPFVSILALKEYLSQQDSVNYADDQIFFGNEEFKINDNPEIGLVNSDDPNKTKWVMKDGKWLDNGLKFLGFRLTKNWEFLSETRNGVVAGINKHFLSIFSNEGIKRLEAVNSAKKLGKYLDWIVKKDIKINQKEVLLNISKRKIFGFIMSCMQINDWQNDHSLEDQRKAVRNHLKKLHKNSLTGRVPSNLDSTKSISFLLAAITTCLGGKAKYPFSIHGNGAKDNGLWEKPMWFDHFERATAGPHLNDPMLMLLSKGDPIKWLKKRRKKAK